MKTTKILFETELETETETETELEADIKPDVNVSVQVKKFSFKYAIMGILLGFLVVVCYFMIKYISGTKLHIAEDMEKYFGIQVFGILRISEMPKRKFGIIDEAIAAFFRTERETIPNGVQMEIISTRILAAVQKRGARKIYLSGVYQSEASQNFIVDIQKRLSKDVELISYGDSILNNTQSLKNMIESDSAVLMECVDGSAYDSIKREIAICKENGVKIIGSVIFN